MNPGFSDTPLEISVEQARSALEQEEAPFLLDCRTVREWEVAKIAAATLLPMHELPLRVGEIEEHRHRPFIIHCHHGGRSLQVAQWLREQGFLHAQSMAGGIDAWSVEIDATVPRY